MSDEQETASIEGPELKLERAKEHLRDLEGVLEEFFETKPYLVDAEDNPESGEREFRVVRAQPIPRSVTVIAGDLVHNLRSVLDHLIWQLVLANGGKPNRKTAFPIWWSESDFVAGRPGYAKGVSETALDVLYGLKPYKGGSEALWRVHQLDIVDKHRLLLALGTRQQSLVLDLRSPFFVAAREAGWGTDPEFPPTPLGLTPRDQDIISEGSVLMSGPLGDNGHGDVEFTFQVALYEPEIPVYEPLIKTLQELTSFVGEVVALFKPLLP